MPPEFRRSPRPVGTCQLKHFSQFLAHFLSARDRGFSSPFIRFQSARTNGIVVPMADSASMLRTIRTRLGLSQAECAMALGVALETFRTWDAGRRPAPEAIVNQAQTLKAKRPIHDRVPLQVLADELHVHVRTLRAAAHDGRLAATFGPRSYFGKLTATATRAAASRFMATWYRRTYGRGQRRPIAVCRVSVPANYAAMLVGLRHRLGLSQQQLAAKVGAASKAVVYQWESGKRKPSRVFWLRVERLKG
jgi:DNA-binding transcriptional regulator YiaG